MSYILDALKRADAERERGTVPGVHAQPMPLPSLATERPRRTWLIGGAVAVAALLLAVWVGRISTPGAPEPAAAVSAVVTPRPAVVAAAPASSTEAVPSPGLTVTQPSAAATKPPIVRPTTPALASPAPPAPAPATALRSAAPELAAAPVPPLALRVTPALRVPAQATPPTTGASTPAIDKRLYAISELPENIRSQLPALAVTGSTYSESAALRTLIINGKVFQERDSLGPDLRLEQIGPKAAVLNFRGYRYQLGY